MRITCGKCGRGYILARELSGLAFRMKCKTCGQVIAVGPVTPAPPARPPDPPPAPVAPEAAAPAPAVERPPRAPRDGERAEAAARPAEPPPPRQRHRKLANPRLLQPTFVLSAILVVLAAVYFFLNRDPDAKPVPISVSAPAQVAPSKVDPSPPPQADPATRSTTAGTHLP